MIDERATYELLRNLTSPVVAVTAAHEGRVNGQIANSGGRASLIPSIPRVLVQLSKEHLTHAMVLASGAFCLHLLRTSQVQMVYRLGFATGHDAPKLTAEDYRLGESGSPILKECFAYFDCQVSRTLDLGPSTLIVGNVLAAGEGAGDGDLMTSPFWRANMPEAWRPSYEADLKRAQEFAKKYIASHPDAL